MVYLSRKRLVGGGDDDEEDVKLGFLTEVSCTRLALCCPGLVSFLA